MIFLLLIILIIVFSLLIENYRELHSFEVKTYELHSSKLKTMSGLNLVFVSDLHNCSYGRKNHLLLDTIVSLKPDVILIGGDMITRSDLSSYEKTFPVIKALSEIAPVYYANGNHEQKLKLFPEKYSLKYEELAEFIRECDIPLLENQTVRLTIKGQELLLTGLEIPVEGYSYFNRKKITYEDIEACIGERQDADTYQILLAHNPMHMKLYKQWNADLILSGHLHGGIVRIPFLGGVIAPDFIPFPKYSGGWYHEEGRDIIVSNGLGTHSIPVRIHCPAQLIQIKLDT